MGAVVSAVSSAFEAVGDAFESVGDVVSDVAQGVADVVDDAGVWFDENVTQPIADDPITAAVAITAVAYGGPLAASYFGTSATVGTMVAAGTTSAATTLAKGGDINDALKAGVFTAGTVGLTAGVSQYAGGATGSQAAGRIIGATAGGAGGAALTGRDPLTGAITSGIAAGISEGVDFAFEQGKSALQPDAPEIRIGGKPSEFGLSPEPRPSTIGLDASIKSPISLDSSGLAVDSGTFGTLQPKPFMPLTPLTGDYGTIKTTLGIGSSREFAGLDPTPREDEFGTLSTRPKGAFGELNPALPAGGLQPMYQIGSMTSELEENAKRLAKKTLTEETLESLYGASPSAAVPSSITYRVRGRGADEIQVGDIQSGGVNLAEVGTAKYELRKFENPDSGQSTLIPFKDDQPQAPIPQGYQQVEVVGKAKGGLIDRPKTTMVKYSEKPLLAPRKKVTKPKKTASKGLASKK